MRTTKYQVPWFTPYDQEAIQTHLEAMAARGWLVEKLGQCFWRYRRIEPKPLRFAVTYVPKATAFDPVPTQEQRRLEDYSAQTGWLLAAQNGQMHIFYNEGEDPVPMETDPVTQVETIRRAMTRGALPTALALAAFCAYLCFFWSWQFRSDPVEFLSTPTSLYLPPMFLLLVLTLLWEKGAYLLWYRRAKKAAAQGSFLPVKTHVAGGMVLLLCAIVFLLLTIFHAGLGRWVSMALCAVVAVVGLVTNGARLWMRARSTPRGVNRAVTTAISVLLTQGLMVGLAVGVIRFGSADGHEPVGTYGVTDHFRRDVYDDPIPLGVEELTAVADVDWSRERQVAGETVLLTRTDYRQWPLTDDTSVPGLAYTVTQVKAPALYEFCRESLIGQREDVVADGEVVLRDGYVAVDAAPWGAQAAYQHHWSDSVLENYLLCYEDRFVEISFDWTPTAEQMAVVGEKLGK